MSGAQGQPTENVVRIAPRAGASDMRPANAGVGQFYWDITLSQAIWWDGEQWVNCRGEAVEAVAPSAHPAPRAGLVRVPPSSGASYERPALPVIGQGFFDTTLKLPIWWNGVTWVNWNGEPVS